MDTFSARPSVSYTRDKLSGALHLLAAAPGPLPQRIADAYDEELHRVDLRRRRTGHFDGWSGPLITEEEASELESICTVIAPESVTSADRHALRERSDVELDVLIDRLFVLESSIG